ncbi:histidine kinase [uncultured Gammaproteobacteria bacterium]
MLKGIPALWIKFLVILIPILAISTFIFSMFFFFSKYSELRGRMETRIQAIAGINASALANSLWTFDSSSTRRIVEAIAVNQDILCIEVVDDLANSTYSWPEIGCSQFKSQPHLARDIHVRERRVGYIKIYFSFESIDHQIREVIFNGFALVLVLMVVTVITASIAFRFTIGVPLNRLLESIVLADSGQERQPVVWGSSDEFGRVIGAYNRMLAKLTAEETALRRSQERLRLAIAATRSSVWDHDLRTSEYWWSEEFPPMLGYDPDELPVSSRTWESLVHPDDIERVVAESMRHVTSDADSFQYVYRLRRKDGEWMWVENKATAIRDADGIAVRLTGIVADITERRRMELDLAHERAILQATLENVDQGIVMVDRDLRLVTFNRRAADMLNVPLKLLTRRPLFDEIVRCQIEQGEFADYDDVPDRLQAAPGESLPPEFPTFKRRRPDGSVLEIRTNSLFEGGFVRTYTDVTAEAGAAEEIFAAMQATERAYAELKETQANLVQAEKMASLGLLVAGVAHEINTPVGIAYSCATHLAGRTSQLDEAYETGAMKKSDLKGYVATAVESSRLILANLTRAAELIQSFKQVAVDQASAERRHFDLKTYIEEVVTSLGPRLRVTAHRVTVACPDGLILDSYPGALSQVLTNLVMNALVHAFDAAATGIMHIAVTRLGTNDIELTFADNGRGISAANLNRIFEPFFTTRRGSGGSGLGLHIVFNLVTQSLGGRISVTSNEGLGTIFTLRLPAEAPAGRPERPDKTSLPDEWTQSS